MEVSDGETATVYQRGSIRGIKILIAATGKASALDNVLRHDETVFSTLVCSCADRLYRREHLEILG